MVTLLRAVQPEKQDLGREVTPSSITRVVKAVQSANVFALFQSVLSTSVAPAGIVTDSRDLQPPNAP